MFLYIHTLYYLIPTACFGAWDLGPQHGFARIAKWTCTAGPLKARYYFYLFPPPLIISIIIMLYHTVLLYSTIYFRLQTEMQLQHSLSPTMTTQEKCGRTTSESSYYLQLHLYICHNVNRHLSKLIDFQ